MPKVFIRDAETGKHITERPLDIDIGFVGHVGDTFYLDSLPFEIKSINHHVCSGKSYEIELKVTPKQ